MKKIEYNRNFCLTNLIIPFGLVFNVCCFKCSNGLILNHELENYFLSGDLSRDVPTDDYIDEDINLRYETYPFDESTYFTDATTIANFGTTQGVYNDLNDVDYFYLPSDNNSRFFHFTIDIGSSFSLYKKIGSAYYLMMNFPSISNLDLIFTEKNCDYYFKISANSNYTGFYIFNLSSATVNTNNYLIHAFYNSNNHNFAKFIIEYYNPINLPSSNIKCPNNTMSYSVSTTYSINDYTRGYYDDADGYKSGIFNANNEHSVNYNFNYENNVNPADDNRKFTAFETYPSSSICFTTFRERLSTKDRKATSFFVDESVVMSTAHIIYSPQLKCFCNNYFLCPDYNSAHETQSLNHGQYTITDAFFPLNFMIDSVNENPNRIDDWAVMVTDMLVEPISTFNHGYLGLKYNSSTPDELRVYGYPILFRFFQNNLNPNQDGDFRDRCLTSAGSVILYNGIYKTYIDVSHGNSGGPSVEFVDNEPFVRGIVSSAFTNYDCNTFSMINAKNFYLVENLVGVI